MTQIKDYNFTIYFSKQADKDIEKIKRNGLKEKVEEILNIMIKDPFSYPPSYEKLTGDYAGLYSRRINRQHRIVYKVDEINKTIYVYTMWTHYDNVKY